VGFFPAEFWRASSSYNEKKPAQTLVGNEPAQKPGYDRPLLP